MTGDGAHQPQSMVSAQLPLCMFNSEPVHSFLPTTCLVHCLGTKPFQAFTASLSCHTRSSSSTYLHQEDPRGFTNAPGQFSRSIAQAIGLSCPQKGEMLHSLVLLGHGSLGLSCRWSPSHPQRRCAGARFWDYSRT